MLPDWNFEARRVLRQQMAVAGLDYADLASRLAHSGLKMTPKALNNKINRGTFTFAFFLQCMNAMGLTSISLSNV